MAEPIKIHKPLYEESELRELSRQITDSTKEFIQGIRRLQENPLLVDDPIHLGHFAKSILRMHEGSKIAKSLE